MIKELEMKMWDAAKEKNKKAFLNLVDDNAVMVCGGYRCLGREYAGIIPEFDCTNYEFLAYEEIMHTSDMCQIHYVIKLEVSQEENKDLEGEFHVTSTWKKKKEGWRLIFNMDSRIIK
jgi:hypothetical protein